MNNLIIGLIAGFFIGVFIGIMFMCALYLSKKGDD